MNHRTTTILLILLGTTLPAQGKRAPSEVMQWAITPELKTAAANGLKWLAEQQSPAGYWAQDVGFKLNTDYRVTENNVSHVGVSALALMSFLAGGHLPGRGQHGKVIGRGLDYVISTVRENGYITDNGSRMYSHAFATLFLAEVYGMTGRADVRSSLQKAVNMIVDSQNHEGGWRYKPFARESDMSITVCQVMGLRAARNVGITVPSRTIMNAENYVRQSAVHDGGPRRRSYSPAWLEEGGAFRYQLGSHSRATFPLTAAGVTTLYAAGIYDDDLIRRAFDYMDAQLATFNDHYGSGFGGHYFFYYGHYYAVQAYYIAGGRAFDSYFRSMSRTLLDMQQADGSWPCRTGPGEAFSTAVATLILQIPFQYLPIFQR